MLSGKLEIEKVLPKTSKFSYTMDCDTFNPRVYAMKLMAVGMEHTKPHHALESYIHVDTCDHAREEFYEYVEQLPYRSNERGLLYAGAMVVGSLLEDFEN